MKTKQLFDIVMGFVPNPKEKRVLISLESLGFQVSGISKKGKGYLVMKYYQHEIVYDLPNDTVRDWREVRKRK